MRTLSMARYSYLSSNIRAGIQFYLILLVLSVGCGAPRHMVEPESSSFPFGQGTSSVNFSNDAKDARSQTRPYILQVGDAIDIKFYRAAELNESVTIRPDGKISLQYVRDVQ